MFLIWFLMYSIKQLNGKLTHITKPVDFREASKKGWTRLTDTCHRLTFKVTDLQEGGVYYFRVTGENEYGVGVPAETKEGTKITGIEF